MLTWNLGAPVAPTALDPEKVDAPMATAHAEERASSAPEGPGMELDVEVLNEGDAVSAPQTRGWGVERAAKGNVTPSKAPRHVEGDEPMSNDLR